MDKFWAFFILWAFPFGSGYTLQCQLALRDSVGIFAAIPNAKADKFQVALLQNLR
jgi:hypothetical protein